MQPLELRNHILRLAIPAPLTDPYERQWRARKRKKVWYSSQKEHWLGWLQEYDGPGYYGRTIRVRTAEYCFNHIQCPPMLLWLGEACGLPRPVILSALAVCGMIDGHQAQCQMVRQHISWCRVHDRLVK